MVAVATSIDSKEARLREESGTVLTLRVEFFLNCVVGFLCAAYELSSSVGSHGLVGLEYSCLHEIELVF